MNELVILTYGCTKEVCFYNNGTFIKAKDMFLAPTIISDDTEIAYKFYECNIDFVQNGNSFSIFDSSSGSYSSVITSVYNRLEDGRITVVDECYEAIILTPEAYVQSYNIFKKLHTIFEHYNEIEDIMCSIRCSGNIACVPIERCKFFEKFCKILGVKILLKLCGQVVFGIPFDVRKESIELIVPDGLDRIILKKYIRNLVDMANNMNVSRVQVVSSSFMRVPD